MNVTKPLFLDNTYLYAINFEVIATGIDEKGYYFVPDTSIYYPQGGGQPQDLGHISFAGQAFPILSARYAEEGIRHYLNDPLPDKLNNNNMAMHICQQTRQLQAAYHTAGHWLSQIVLENLQLPLMPVKGHHFPKEAYIECEGDNNFETADVLDKIRIAMRLDLQANLQIKTTFAEAGSAIFTNALLPCNFQPPVNKPLRFTQIESYRWVPCGGTHLASLRGIKNVVPTGLTIKGGKIRLKYSCEVQDIIAS